MRTRRGADLWSGELGDMIHQYEPGDIVVSTIVEDSAFTGVVRSVDVKTNKISVAWGGGSLNQHDPDEIMLHPYGFEVLKDRLGKDMKVASRRVKQAVPGFMIGEFVARFLQFYSQLFMFHWQATDYAAHIAYEEANEDMEDLMDKFVEAYQGKFGLVTTDSPIEVVNCAQQCDEEFIVSYRDFLVLSKEGIADNDDLANILDEMVARLNKLLYLLTLE